MIVSNEKIKRDIFLLKVKDNKIAANVVPGQFVHVKIGDSFLPLLRRPFSIHDVDGNIFTILYKIRGRGTFLLSKYRPGDQVDIIGPLGNGFDVKKYDRVGLVAGGMGVAPIYFLTRKLQVRELTILLGTKTKEELVHVDGFSKLGKLKITTEDGSLGTKGMVTDMLEDIIGVDFIAACGPNPMLRVVKSFTAKHNIPCQLSLEGRMACGLGVCLGCAVKSANSYKYVCKDGPVFWSSEVDI
jgi:dihydroorotate dehydrogenase electron transfer subunit